MSIFNRSKGGAQELSRSMMERRDSLENPSVPLSSPQAWALIAGEMTSLSGINLSEFTALRSSSVWRSVHLISSAIAQCPLHLWEGNPDTRNMREMTDQPWLYRPNYDMSWYEFIETTMSHLLLWGNAYWLPVLNNAGTQVVQMWLLPPWATFASRKPTNTAGVPGRKVYNLAVGNGLQLPDFNISNMKAGGVIHIPGMGYDGVRGLSPISHLRESLAVGIAAEQYASRFFGSGSLMSGIISVDKKLTDDQQATIKARWRERMTGLSKAHEVLVMDGSMKFIPLTIPPDDAQFLQTRQFSVEETARMFGIPPHLLMQTEKTTTWGTGIAEQSLAFIRYTLNDWYKRIEGRVTMSLCPYNAITNQPQQYAEFDVSPLLKGDQAARYASYAVARATGWLCGNEIRTMEGMETGDDPSLNAYGPTVITVPTLPKAKEPQDA